jgi:hypothetical protein
MAVMQQMQSIFPDYPRESPVLDKEGNFNALWDLGLGSLFQALQENFKNEGILLPPLTAANMTVIQNLYTSFIGGLYSALTMAQPDISGQTVFDSTTSITNQFVIEQDGSTPPKVLLAQWVPFAMMLTNSGNPNGVVGGALNWLCLDTAGPTLYACTTAGSSAGQGSTTQAVWTKLVQ